MDYKTLFLNHIHLPIDFKVNNLQDLSIVMKAVQVYVPLNNLEILDQTWGEITKENVIQKVLIEKTGGLCMHLNLVLLYFMQEIGLDCFQVKVLPSEKNAHLNIKYHIFNVLNYHDGKQYIVDVASGASSTLTPLEIGGGEELVVQGINGTLCRCKSNDNNDGTWLFECKFTPESDWACSYHFDLTPIGYKEINQSQYDVANDNVKFLLNRRPLVYRLSVDSDNNIDGGIALTAGSLTETKKVKVKKSVNGTQEFNYYLNNLLNHNGSHEIKPCYTAPVTQGDDIAKMFD